MLVGAEKKTFEDPERKESILPQGKTRNLYVQKLVLYHRLFEKHSPGQIYAVGIVISIFTEEETDRDCVTSVKSRSL